MPTKSDTLTIDPMLEFEAADAAFAGMIGRSPAMKQLFEQIGLVAEDGESTVLIQGESGTGKELVAQAVHQLSPQRVNNYVPVNCAAIPDELLESELFGYVQGAFTGATKPKIGRIRYADGGTLFLDEIGDMKPSLQAKLLRVLQEKTIEPVGGVQPVSVDVRIIAATHQNLEQLVKDGRFREDLYYRLSVIPLTLPPLRQRPEDIPLLIDYFIRKRSRRRTEGPMRLERDAMEALLHYEWPGNIRELENLMQRLIILKRGQPVGLVDLPEKYRQSCPVPPPASPATRDAAPLEPSATLFGDETIDFNALVSAFEDRLILQALERASGNKKEAARLLGLKRTTLLEKLKKKGIGGDDPPG